MANTPAFKIVLIRHGESTWNQENRFTGWTDVPLAQKGVEEAHRAASVLKKEGFEFDVAYTSVLTRAIKTLWIVMEDMDCLWLPVNKSWKLNERHYGALQGLNKSETAQKHGEQQVQIWRRSYDIQPPALEESDQRWPGKDRRYKDLKQSELPKTECLKDTVDRVVPYWKEVICPTISSGKRVVIVAHGNSLRGLVKYLDNMSDQEIIDLNIPTGVPLVYELDHNLKALKHYYLGDEEQIKMAMQSVANQGKAK